MEQRKDLSYLFEGLLHIPQAFDRSIAHISQDSRDMQNGGLFFARSGSQTSGEEFWPQAQAAGAVALVVEAEQLSLDHLGYGVRIGIPDLPQVMAQIAARFYDYPGEKLDIIGVTGTNGKTTVTQLVAQLLDKLGRRCGIIGTLGWGFFGQLNPGPNTTPDPIGLQWQLHQLLQQGAQAVAIEISSHALVQQRVAALPVDIAVFTNLTRDHLDFHGSMEAYAEAKQQLFGFPGLSTVVLNTDDPFGLHLLDYCRTRVPVRSYSLKGCAAVVQDPLALIAHETEASESGISARVCWQGQYQLLHSPLLGLFNLANLLAATQVVLALGYPLESFWPLLSSVKPVLGRMQSFALPNGALAVVDFAHTPDALVQALSALRLHCRGQLGCVFGCGGDRDAGKRPLMAQAAELADWLVLTSDNPRSEDPQQILAQIEAGLSGSIPCQTVPDRAQAIQQALSRLKPEDLLLIAGKGHESYQWIGTDKRPFSDQQQVTGYLESLT